MNNHVENRVTPTVNHDGVTASSIKDDTAGGCRGGLAAAKRWVSFLPLKLMSSHRKPRKMFSSVKRKMLVSLVKLKSFGTRAASIQKSKVPHLLGTRV
jgi:hypothetical protein